MEGETPTLTPPQLTRKLINGPGNTTTLNADIITSGNPITINDNIKIGNNVTLDTTNRQLNPTGADITLNGNINSVNSTPQNLNLTAGNQNIIINGSVGNEQLLNNLTLNTQNTIQLNGELIKTIGNQTYRGNVQIGNNITLDTTDGNTLLGGAISLNGNINSVTSPQNLTIQTNNQTITIEGTIGNEQRLNELRVTSQNIQLNGGSIKTSGNQTYRGNITLGANTTFNATATFLADSLQGEGKEITVEANTKWGDSKY